jgi:hexosaminidase
MLKNLKQMLGLFTLLCVASHVFSQTSIIPKPQQVIMKQGTDSFVLSPKTVIVLANTKLKPSADFLNDYLKQVYGFALKIAKKPGKDNNINISQAPVDNAIEGSYGLDISKDNLSINGKDEAGAFYGIQTVIQLLPLQKSQALNIPLLQINDAPRYGYRGFMLDVGRHFFPPAIVKKYIDYLALHKMNYLHWHLTEDQGWRIEIKKYPRLAEVAAFRDGTIIGHYPGTGNDSIRYGGFYTQEEIKDIVKYAASHYITIVPEIEMPGHSAAALTAYPYLGCTGGPYKVQQTWGVHNDVYCAGNDSVFSFLQDVLDEVFTLFPSKYVHIGGDECPKDNWKKCPKCQQRMKENHLKDEHELQSYFVQRMEKYINSKGRILIGWDEILEGGLAPNAMVMSWRGEKGGIEAAKQKHDVIMTPNSHMYFDHYQGNPATEPLAIGGYLTLERVYSYNPTPAELTAEEGKYIKGVQANLWTEYIADPKKLEYMTMPRLAALSEVAWTASSQKNWDDFKLRMEKQYNRYAMLGINYAQSALEIRQTIILQSAISRANVTLATDSYAPQIFYTIDGSEPGINSKVYTKPFDIYKSATVKAAGFKDGIQVGKTSVQPVVLSEAK